MFHELRRASKLPSGCSSFRVIRDMGMVEIDVRLPGVVRKTFMFGLDASFTNVYGGHDDRAIILALSPSGDALDCHYLYVCICS